MVMAAIMALLVFAGDYADRQDAALSRTIIRQEVVFSVSDLRQCLDASRVHGLALNGRWIGGADTPDGTQGYNRASGLRITIRDEGTRRLVEVVTLRGRDLRDYEQAQVSACLNEVPAS